MTGDLRELARELRAMHRSRSLADYRLTRAELVLVDAAAGVLERLAAEQEICRNLLDDGSCGIASRSYCVCEARGIDPLKRNAAQAASSEPENNKEAGEAAASAEACVGDDPVNIHHHQPQGESTTQRKSDSGAPARSPDAPPSVGSGSLGAEADAALLAEARHWLQNLADMQSRLDLTQHFEDILAAFDRLLAGKAAG